MSDVYVQNTHNAPITCNGRNGKTVLFTKKFMPTIMDKWSGKDISTGYSKITKEELDVLQKTSNTFKHYKDDLKYLVVHTELPEALKSPHQALGDLKARVKELEKQLEASEAKVKELETAKASKEK